MGGLSIWHWLVVAIIVMLLFGGRGRFSDLMGDVGKGIKSFKKGLTEDEEQGDRPPPRLQSQQTLDPNPSHDLQPMKDDRPQD